MTSSLFKICISYIPTSNFHPKNVLCNVIGLGTLLSISKSIKVLFAQERGNSILQGGQEPIKEEASLNVFTHFHEWLDINTCVLHSIPFTKCIFKFFFVNFHKYFRKLSIWVYFVSTIVSKSYEFGILKGKFRFWQLYEIAVHPHRLEIPDVGNLQTLFELPIYLNNASK